MASPITPAQLDADCRRVVDKVGRYSPQVGALIAVMYNIGCREGEVLDRARWAQHGGEEWYLLPQKGNPTRIVQRQDLPPLFVHWLTGSGFPNRLSSLMNLRRVVDQFSFYPNATCGRKQISTHRFRHNRIKLLHAAGQTESQIMAYMGLTSRSTVRGYINSEIMQ